MEANAAWKDAINKGNLHYKVFPTKEYREEVLIEFSVLVFQRRVINAIADELKGGSSFETNGCPYMEMLQDSNSRYESSPIEMRDVSELVIEDNPL